MYEQDMNDYSAPFDFNSINDDSDVELVESNTEYEHEPAHNFDDEDGLWDTDEDSEEELASPKEVIESVGGDLALLDDDFELSIGEEKITKAELMGRLNTVNEFKEKNEQFSTYFQNFQNIDRQMDAVFVASATENDIKLTNIKNKLSQPGITDTQRGQLYGEMNKLENNKRVLDERVQSFFAARELRDQQAELVRLTQTNNEMTGKYGAKWVDNMAPAVTQYINNSGIASAEMRKALSPALIEVLIKAMKFDKQAKGVEERINSTVKRKAPAVTKSVGSTSNSRGKKVTKSEATMRRAQREGDHATLFQFIKD